MALVNFKKGLLASLPSTYAEGTFYVTTDERAIYLDVAADKRIRLGDFQEFATLADLEANANPSTSALYYITEGNILAKWDGEKYVQINVQKTLAELGGVSKATFDSVIYDQGEGEAKVKGLISKVADLESAVEDLTSVGATKVEDSETNGNIKIDGVETVVYDDTALAGRVTTAEGKITALETESAKHAIKTEVEGALAGKADTAYVGTFTHATAKTVVEYINAKTDGIATSGNLEALGQRVGTIEGDYLKAADKTELEGKINAKVNTVDYNADKATFALKTEVNAVDAKFANYNTTTAQKAIDDAQDARIKAIEDDYLVATDIANFETKENVKKVSDDLAGYKTSNDAALAGVKATAESKTTAAEVKTQIEAYSYATTTELSNVDKKFENYKTAADQKTIDDEQDRRLGLLEAKPFDTYATKDELGNVDDKFASYRTSAAQDVIDNGIKGRIDVVEGILNDKTEGEVTTKGLVSRVEVLEAIDHDKLAEDASAAAVAAVLDGAPEKFDTLKEIAAWIADANTAEDAASLVTRVSTIEGDYLKSADKTELEGKINTKTTTAEVKAQIEAYSYATEADLTLAEGRIKAIKDDYLKGADKTALQAEIDADVKVVSDALAEHVKVDHNFAAADAALKSELQAEIDADVKVVSDALGEYKTANNAAVALKANSADVYAKTETFTKDEVNAAIATALTWGTF